MIAPNPSTDASRYQIAWGKALQHLDHLPREKQRYLERLKPAEQVALRNDTTPSEILQLLRKAGAIKQWRLVWVSPNLAKEFSKFKGVFEATELACSEIGAPIWGPIKLILELAMSVADEAWKIQGFLRDILQTLVLFQEIEANFKPSPGNSWGDLYDALAYFYADVIDFALMTAKHYRSSIFGYLTRWNWNTFDSDFGGVISNMKRHSDLIAPAMQPTTMKEKKLEEDYSRMEKTETGLKLAYYEAISQDC